MSIIYRNNEGYITAEKYVGQVLMTGEHNYYDDSDFYAVVFDVEENKVKEITYDTTRFAPSGNDAFADATEETLNAYHAAKDSLKKKLDVEHAWHNHNARLAIHQATGLTYNEIKKLMNVYSEHSWCFDVCCSLLSTKNFRSNFRKSIAEQLRVWIKEENPKYATPLSDRQLDLCYNKHIKKYWERYDGYEVMYNWPEV